MNFDSENVVGNILGKKKVKTTKGPNQPKHFIKDPQARKTVQYAVGGGILGAFVGAPGVGAVIGAVAANQGKLEKAAKKFDKNYVGKKK